MKDFVERMTDGEHVNIVAVCEVSGILAGTLTVDEARALAEALSKAVDSGQGVEL